MNEIHNFGRACVMIFFLIIAVSLKAFSHTTLSKDLDTFHQEPSLLSNDDQSEQELIAFAKKLIGVKYKYGAASPSQGFDCSGFVYYVFKQFGVTLPRSSSGIGQAGEEISLSSAKAGDIILFTGTNPANRTIGHVGIVLSHDNEQGLRFIHATSGKAYGVTETTLGDNYKKRFVKVIRVS